MVKQEIGEGAWEPEKFLLESLYLAGYTGALAKPLVASKEDYRKVDGSLVEKFYIVRSQSIYIF
jgi:mitochondrial-processing peptidase subunit alpha